MAWLELGSTSPERIVPCLGGLPLVVSEGRVLVAGMANVVFDRPGRRIVDVDCGRHDRIYLLDAEGVVYGTTRVGQPWHRLAELGPGRHHLGGADHAGVWIWSRRESTILRRLEAGELRPPKSIAGPIVAATPAGMGRLVVATPHSVRLLDVDGDARELLSTELRVDGVAVDENGRLIVSTERGLVRRDVDGTMAVLSRGLHGPIATGPWGIYILWRSAGRLAVLEPGPVAGG